MTLEYDTKLLLKLEKHNLRGGIPIKTTVKPFDELNFPSLLTIITTSEYTINKLPQYQKWRIHERHRRLLNAEPMLINSNEIVMLDTVQIWDTITKKIVNEFGNESKIIFSKFCLSKVAFWSINDPSIIPNTTYINEIYYDNLTNIMVQINYNKDIYKITKYKINYISKYFNYEKIGEIIIDIKVTPLSNEYSNEYLNEIVRPIFINDDIIMLVRSKPIPGSNSINKEYQYNHTSVFVNSSNLSIINTIPNYSIASDTIFKQRYILLTKNHISFILYDFININTLKKWTFTSKTTVLSTTNDMIVFGNNNIGIEIYNFVNDIPEDEMCLVCTSRIVVKYAIIPCGHTLTCLSCLEHPQLINCPICRGNKTHILRLY